MGEASSRSRLRTRAVFVLRVFLTIAAWIAFIVYAHHLGHAYLGDIKSALGSATIQVVAQVVILSALIYFVLLSVPFLPNLGIRGVSVLVIWTAILVSGHQLSHEGFHQLQDALAAAGREIGVYGLAAGAVVYVLVLALPFIPGMEFGLLLMVLFGRDGVIVAYVATVAGLSLSFLAARAVPDRIALNWIKRFGLSNAAVDPADALGSVVSGHGSARGAGARLRDLLLSHRYLMLAVCLNLPGNSVIGGGGGIAALCGLSKQFQGWRFALTLIVATAPLPLLVLVGQIEIGPLLERHGIVHDLLTRMAGMLLHE